MPDWLPVVLLLVGELFLPAVLAMVLPVRYRNRLLALAGLVALVALVITAERSSLVENGGDSNGGWKDWFLAIILNGVPLVVLWAAGAFVGTKMRTRHLAR